VRDQNVWTAAQMEQRGKTLANQAITLWPSVTVDKAQITAAENAETRERAKQSEVGSVPMSADAKSLFDLLRIRVLELDPDISEIGEQKSVSYHSPDFFLEVLPRQHQIILILPIELNEVEDPFGIAKDTSERAFFANARYDGGISILIRKTEDIEKALPIIRQAREFIQ
jgi:predicted transport protein